MFSLIKSFVEVVSGILLLLSIRINIFSFLAITFGIAILIVGLYYAFEKKIKSLVHFSTGSLLLLAVVGINIHPLISVIVGLAIFVIGIIDVLKALMDL